MRFKIGQTLKIKREIRCKDRIKGFCYIPVGALVEVVSIRTDKLPLMVIRYEGEETIVPESIYDEAFEKT
jgi:hypothetical protein